MVDSPKPPQGPNAREQYSTGIPKVDDVIDRVVEGGSLDSERLAEGVGGDFPSEVTKGHALKIGLIVFPGTTLVKHFFIQELSPFDDSYWDYVRAGSAPEDPAKIVAKVAGYADRFEASGDLSDPAFEAPILPHEGISRSLSLIEYGEVFAGKLAKALDNLVTEGTQA